MIVNLYEVSQTLCETLPAHITEVRHDVLYETVSILLLVRQQLQRIYYIPTCTLKTLAWLTLSPVCTTKSLFGCFQSYFSPQIAQHQFVCFFPS